MAPVPFSPIKIGHIDNVQELRKARPTSIPERFVRDKAERQSVATPSMHIVIDLSKLIEGDLDHFHSELSKLAVSCEEWGFFQVINHGIDTELLQSIEKVANDFFMLPLAEKQKYPIAPGTVQGYGQAFVFLENQKLDWCNMLALGVEPHFIRNPKLWPTNPANFRVTIMDPEMIRDILSNKSGHIRKSKITPTGRLLVTGLVSYEGEKWVKHRRLINPAFHLEKLKMMQPAFHTSCSEMVKKWQKLVPEESSELDVWPELQNLTADVISRSAFGSSYEEGRRIFQLQSEQADLLIQSFQTIHIPGFKFFPTKRNKRMKEINREVGTLLRDMIKKREKAMRAEEALQNDLLGLLMESNFSDIKANVNSKNVGISIDEVIEECKLFYFAGQETTSTLLVWTMVVLSMHPEWQEKAREEVLKFFGREAPDFDGLNHLKIVTMILNEVLRLYSPVASLLRTTCEKTKLGEVVLPPGVQITMPILIVQHDPEIWGEDAEEFNPERFSEGISRATKNQVSMFPFGWGPRICIGQNFALIEAKLAIAMILQHFSFELSSTYIHAPRTVVTLQPQHGAQLILHKL